MATQAQSPAFLTRFFTFTGKSLRILVYILLGTLLAIWLFSPLAIRLGLNHVLDEQNLSIDDNSIVRINPFLARLSIEDLVLHENQEKVLKTDALIVDIAWLPLLQHEVNIEAFTIAGFSINSQFNKNGQLQKIAGFILPKATEETDTTSAEQPVIPWRITVNESLFSDSIFNLYLPHKKQAIALTHLNLRQVELSQQIQALNLALQVKVDGTTLDLTSDIKLAQGLGLIDSQITLSQIDLATLKSWLPDQAALKPLKGIVDIKVASKINISTNNVDIVKNKIDIKLADIEYTHEQGDILLRDFALSLSDINVNLYQGKPTAVTANIQQHLSDLVIDQLPAPSPKITLAAFDLTIADLNLEFENGLLSEANLPLITKLSDLSTVGGPTPDMVSTLTQFDFSTPKLSLLFEEQRPHAISMQSKLDLHEFKAENANGILAHFSGISLEELAVLGAIEQPEINVSNLHIKPFVLSQVHTIAPSKTKAIQASSNDDERAIVADSVKTNVTVNETVTNETVTNETVPNQTVTNQTTAKNKTEKEEQNTPTSAPAINQETLDVTQTSAESTVELPPLLSSNGITISHFNIDQQDIEIGDIALDHIEANAFINAKKKLSTQVSLESQNDTDEPELNEEASASTSAAETETSAQKPAMRISLNRFELINNAVINVRDESINPAYERGFEFTTLSLGRISTTEPERETPYLIKGKSDRYAVIDFNGFIKPLAKITHYTAQGHIKELDLPGLSPYLKGPLKHEIKTGHFDLGLKVKIINEQIDGDADILLRGLELSAANNIEASTIKDTTAMPLNMAVGVLKDSDNNLELNIPLKGSLSDPSFDGLSGIVVLLSKKAAMKAATSLLMDTFVPYANIVSVAMMAGEYALKVRFNDLEFAPKQSALTAAQITFANDFIALMKDKEDTQINLCAIATPADIDLPAKSVLTSSQIAQLNKLSQARQHAFKDYVSQGGVASARILLCAPTLDNSKDAKPRLSFSS
ncbi:DUF748 domain-containing protein [Algibacillus agarilyticus]|uniref:DUF748 domain-containing protein n=1 Tax=Algibacillus agarilyticus TaxID=2234133 RepID=UPI000DD05850|nr:DUF748 domain-containing protein [Algibacillus agarilyticus]